MKQQSPLRVGIVAVLEENFNKRVLAYDASELDKIYSHLNEVNIVLIDLDTPAPADVLKGVNIAKSQGKKVIVWTSTLDHPYLHETFKMNLDGYFYNGMETDEIIYAIKAIQNSKPYVHPILLRVLLNDYSNYTSPVISKRPIGLLTRREWDALELMVKGYSNEQIANTLWITDKTVKNHVSSVLKKLGVIDRTNAVILALKNRWFAL